MRRWDTLVVIPTTQGTELYVLDGQDVSFPLQISQGATNLVLQTPNPFK